MSKRCLILQHMTTDGPGRFADLLRADGYSLQTVHVYREDIPPLGGYDLMLVLGGAQDTWQTDEHPWLVGEKEAIREWAGQRARPFIGICLGHQLLADALGGSVGMASEREIGVHTIDLHDDAEHPFFRGVSGRQTVLQWHHAEVKTIPDGARALASSPTTRVQALAVGDHALGVQFHFEWTLKWMRAWPEDWVDILEKRKGAGAHERLLADAAPHMDAFGAMSETIYRNFTAITAGRQPVTA